MKRIGGERLARLADRAVILLMCLLGFFSGLSAPLGNSDTGVVTALLCTVIFCAVEEILGGVKAFQILEILTAALCIACLFRSEFVIFVPIVAYELVSLGQWRGLAAVSAAAVIRLGVLLQNLTFTRMGVVCCGCIAVMYLVSVLIAMRSAKMTELSDKLRTTRDSAVEHSNELMLKNRRLIASQDSEIHIATLRERNRIAREIHDNVGHLLTRTLLQMGAICIINSDEQLKEPLESVRQTLDGAMSAIRKSVHDLHDESVDLEASIRKTIEPLRNGREVFLDFDATNALEPNVKYCFAAVVREAVSNIIKHSNSTQVRVIVREHPKIATLMIEDNGTGASLESGGIGLESIRERVDALGGIVNISAEKSGFKIFVSIVKKD